MANTNTPLPTTLLDLLSNSLILRHTTPYVSLASKLSLAASCKAFRTLVIESQPNDSFRYVDLSQVKGAGIKIDDAIDSGGQSWRAERMDEALTEDEFYGGPLLGIFSKLQRRHLLNHVQTLILDGLAVPADLVRDIICEDRFNVRTLSIRQVKHLNERKLLQVLNYAIRPTRAEGTPRLKALYLFGPKDPHPVSHVGVDESGNSEPVSGSQISSDWNQRSTTTLEASLPEKWYAPTGRMFSRRRAIEWSNMLKACEGIIAFDAVLCRGSRHYPNISGATNPEHLQNASPRVGPTIANVALGPSGCVACSSCPEGPAIFGHAPSYYFPLLSPPPLLSSTVRAAQLPYNSGTSPKFIARCEDCLRDRWCERCNKWWDEACYPFTEKISEPSSPSEPTQIFVKRECFGCGPVCGECKDVYIRACVRCRNEYCVADNEGSSQNLCDWCNRVPRRTRELY